MPSEQMPSRQPARRRWTTPTRVRRVRGYVFADHWGVWVRVQVTHACFTPGRARVRIEAEAGAYPPVEVSPGSVHVGPHAPRTRQVGHPLSLAALVPVRDARRARREGREARTEAGSAGGAA